MSSWPDLFFFFEGSLLFLTSVTQLISHNVNGVMSWSQLKLGSEMNVAYCQYHGGLQVCKVCGCISHGDLNLFIQSNCKNTESPDYVDN